VPEILSLAQRIAVLRQGRTIAQFATEEASEERVMALMSGVEDMSGRAAA
jgi:ABC-type uncharacterized transport system ATPase subunit